jgi:uncharacterized protein (DUF2141 family)
VNLQKGTIIAKVIAFRNAEGNIQLSLFDKENRFPELDMRMITHVLPVINSSVMEVRFENVPFGTYAIAGLHDENKSGNMDFSWLGLPKEGYCFSNDARPRFSPPSFSSAKFVLDKPEKVLYIAMQY